MRESEIQRLADCLHCEVGVRFIKYLGLPLGGNPRMVDFWKDMLVKVDED